ncbi:MAG TPA: acyl carrier protein [Puia sp.]|nr:acyl carrier protein [Puia sp.]
MNAIVDKSRIAGKIRAIIVEKLGVEAPKLKDTASFTDDLGLDSLDVLETFTTIEKEFDIKISDEEAEKLTTVGSVIHFVTARAR